MNQTRMTTWLCGAISTLFLAGCGGGSSGSSGISVGGNVTGLVAGTSVTVLNNGSNPTTVAANGSFVFSGTLSSQDAYNVTVGTQPPGQTCIVSNGSGTISFSGANVTNVALDCVANLSIGGIVTGLTNGASVTLQNNFLANETATITANGTYTFPMLFTLGSLYSITVLTQPVGEACTVGNTASVVEGATVESNSGGIVSLAPITNMNVICTPISS
jgi:hypothetical protein